MSFLLWPGLLFRGRTVNFPGCNHEKPSGFPCNLTILAFQRSHVEPGIAFFGQSLWPCLRRISAFWMLFPSAYPGVKLSWLQQKIVNKQLKKWDLYDEHSLKITISFTSCDQIVALDCYPAIFMIWNQDWFHTRYSWIRKGYVLIKSFERQVDKQLQLTKPPPKKIVATVYTVWYRVYISIYILNMFFTKYGTNTEHHSKSLRSIMNHCPTQSRGTSNDSSMKYVKVLSLWNCGNCARPKTLHRRWPAISCRDSF